MILYFVSTDIREDRFVETQEVDSARCGHKGMDDKHTVRTFLVSFSVSVREVEIFTDKQGSSLNTCGMCIRMGKARYLGKERANNAWPWVPYSHKCFRGY